MFPTFGIKAIPIAIVGAAILVPKDNKGRYCFKDKRNTSNYILFLVIVCCAYFVAIIMPSYLEFCQNNKYYYYIWISVAFLLYIMIVYRAFLHYVSSEHDAE